VETRWGAHGPCSRGLWHPQIIAFSDSKFSWDDSELQEGNFFENKIFFPIWLFTIL
jgi:hypothetical protein